jgi:hypothetical protein
MALISVGNLKSISMSAIYQNEVIELTSSDLKVLEQELNQNDDFQALTIVEDEWMDKLLSRWEEPTKVQKEDMLWEESYRLESDLIESENYL